MYFILPTSFALVRQFVRYRQELHEYLLELLLVVLLRGALSLIELGHFTVDFHEQPRSCFNLFRDNRQNLFKLVMLGFYQLNHLIHFHLLPYSRLHCGLFIPQLLLLLRGRVGVPSFFILFNDLINFLLRFLYIFIVILLLSPRLLFRLFRLRLYFLLGVFLGRFCFR